MNSISGFGNFTDGHSYRLKFSSKGCLFCESYDQSMITEPIDLEESDMSKLTSIQSRLNALQNIAFSAHDHEQRGVRVSRSSVSLREGYVFSITFFGHRVLGNLPPIGCTEHNIWQPDNNGFTTSACKYNC